ncbi:hypothetical protein EC973_001886 [Apophysomyces ossiformis]|uniref:Uncharacterized protein n=1 Tax=Apophysomyces ossiformis TaxID=679940 RepID=A0A8H7BPD0_9FUNG|nr:hypothetical protein EC973_001886 [Apophysomyces ossiformis]
MLEVHLTKRFRHPSAEAVIIIEKKAEQAFDNIHRDTKEEASSSTGDDIRKLGTMVKELIDRDMHFHEVIGLLEDCKANFEQAAERIKELEDLKKKSDHEIRKLTQQIEKQKEFVKDTFYQQGRAEEEHKKAIRDLVRSLCGWQERSKYFERRLKEEIETRQKDKEEYQERMTAQQREIEKLREQQRINNELQETLRRNQTLIDKLKELRDEAQADLEVMEKSANEHIDCKQKIIDDLRKLLEEERESLQKKRKKALAIPTGTARADGDS